MSAVVLDAARVAALGFCPACYEAGQPIPVAPGQDRCMTHSVEVARSGQARLAVPRAARIPYPTGIQTPCVSCAAAGRDTLGLPGRDVDEPEAALCIPCWRSRDERRERRTRGRFVDELRGELEAAGVGCGACGSVVPTSECWLCARSWLARVESEFQRDQEAEAAAAAAELEDRFAAIAARTEAEDWLADVTGVVERLQATLEAYARGGGQGRAVPLLADLLARIAATRTTTRGRPPATPVVGAMLALDADWRTGRRSMPGRERTAWLLGISEGAVYNGWQHAVALKWATRIRRGGRNSLQRRIETGRAMDRGEFDLVPLHRSPVDPAVRAEYVPAALAVYQAMFERLLETQAEAQAALEALCEPGTETDWSERTRRAQLREAVTRAEEARTTVAEAVQTGTNNCRTHMVSRGEYVSSCLSRGYGLPSAITCHCVVGRGAGGGEERIGASRSPEGECSGDLGREGGGSHRLAHPRTGRKRDRARTAPTPPPQWAYELAEALPGQWTWLAGARRSWVASVLGAFLGPDWTVPDLLRFVHRRRGGRALLTDPVRPVRYLRQLLEAAFTGGVEPPLPARRTAEHQRERAAFDRVDLRAHQRIARIAHAGQAERARAVPGPGSRVAARGQEAEELFAAVRAKTSGHLRRDDRVELLDRHQEPAPAPAVSEPDWPEVPQPGSGGRKTAPETGLSAT